MISRATVATAHASKYLQQLCKHWNHKFPVTFDDESGFIDFGDGKTVQLAADAEALTIVATDDVDEAGLQVVERVVVDHLKRFAFRENLTFDWIRQPD